MLSIRLCSDVPNGAQRKSIGRTSPNTRKIICDDKSLYYKIEGRRYTVCMIIMFRILKLSFKQCFSDSCDIERLTFL